MGTNSSFHPRSSCGLRLQPLGAETEPMQRLGSQGLNDMELDPEGRFAVVSEILAPVVTIYPLDGSEPTRLEGLDPRPPICRWLTTPTGDWSPPGPPEGHGTRKSFECGACVTVPFRRSALLMTPETASVVAIRDSISSPTATCSHREEGGVRRWSLETRSSTLLLPESCRIGSVAPDGSSAIVRCFDEDDRGLMNSILDLNTSAMRPSTVSAGRFQLPRTHLKAMSWLSVWQTEPYS